MKLFARVILYECTDFVEEQLGIVRLIERCFTCFDTVQSALVDEILQFLVRRAPRCVCVFADSVDRPGLTKRFSNRSDALALIVSVQDWTSSREDSDMLSTSIESVRIVLPHIFAPSQIYKICPAVIARSSIHVRVVRSASRSRES